MLLKSKPPSNVRLEFASILSQSISPNFQDVYKRQKQLYEQAKNTIKKQTGNPKCKGCGELTLLDFLEKAEGKNSDFAEKQFVLEMCIRDRLDTRLKDKTVIVITHKKEILSKVDQIVVLLSLIHI